MTNNKEKPTKQKLLEVVSGNRKLQDIKLIQQKSLYFLCTNNGKVWFERKKTYHLHEHLTPSQSNLHTFCEMHCIIARKINNIRCMGWTNRQAEERKLKFVWCAEETWKPVWVVQESNGERERAEEKVFPQEQDCHT